MIFTDDIKMIEEREERLTKIKCDFTSCKYNESCCTSPRGENAEYTYCTKEEVHFQIKGANCRCDSFRFDYSKDIQCPDCQMIEKGVLTTDLGPIEDTDLELEIGDENDFE